MQGAMVLGPDDAGMHSVDGYLVSSDESHTMAVSVKHPKYLVPGTLPLDPSTDPFWNTPEQLFPILPYLTSVVPMAD